MIENTEQTLIFDAQRWGLPQEAIADLANRLRRIWTRFRDCFTTKTRDTSEYAFTYLRGLLTMDTERNYANIARRVIDPEDDGQNIQQFMSDSPWPARSVFGQIQTEICHRPELSGGMLTLDESGDKRSGNNSAGAWSCKATYRTSGQSGHGTGRSCSGILSMWRLGYGGC